MIPNHARITMSFLIIGDTIGLLLILLGKPTIIAAHAKMWTGCMKAFLHLNECV